MTLDARRRLHDLLESRVDLLRQVEVLSRRRSDAIAADRLLSCLCIVLCVKHCGHAENSRRNVL